jgi:hypothetical protein
MQKKNVTLATVLSFFVFGLLYVEVTKRSVMAMLALMVVSWALTSLVAPAAGLIANIAGAYIGRKCVLENNAIVDADAEE